MGHSRIAQLPAVWPSTQFKGRLTTQNHVAAVRVRNDTIGTRYWNTLSTHFPGHYGPLKIPPPRLIRLIGSLPLGLGHLPQYAFLSVST